MKTIEKKIYLVSCLLVLSLLFISACTDKIASDNIASKFPIDEEGYPEQNYTDRKSVV